MTLDQIIRTVVAVALVVSLLLMAYRWRAWAEASEMRRGLALALVALTISALIGTIAAIDQARPFGVHVAGNLTAPIIAIWALTRRTQDHPHPHKDKES